MKKQMIRNTIILFATLISGNLLAANKYAHSNGDWTSTSIWYTAATGGTQTTKPVAGDNAFTNGKSITVSSDETCDNLTITQKVDAIIINSGKTLTIQGTLLGTANVDAIGGDGTILFTGTSLTTSPYYAIGSGIGANVVFSNITFNSSKTLTVQGYMNINGGALKILGGAVTSQNSVNGTNSTLSVNIGATLTVNSSISYPTITIDGTLNSRNYINSSDIIVNGTLTTSTVNSYISATNIIVNGTLTASSYISTTNITINGSLTTSNYVNASSDFTLNAAANFYTSYSGDEGWWSATNRPTSTLLDGTITLNGTDQQIGGNLTYNNLTITSSGTSTLSNNIIVNGLLTISSNTTFNAQSYIVDGGGGISIEDLSTFITSNADGINGTNTTTNGYSFQSGYANFVFNGSGAQETGSQMPDNIQNLTADNTSVLTLSKTLGCDNVNTTTDAQLIIPAGIGLTSQINASFAKPLILKTSTTPNRPQMGTFINYGSVNGQITMEMSYTTNGNAGNTGRGLYFSSPITDATSNIVGANGTTNRLLYVDESTRKWVEIKNLTTPLTVAKGYLFRSTSSAVFSFTGTPNADSYYEKSDIARADSKQFYIMGNPYPAVIDWNAVTKTNLSHTIWYRSSTTAGKMVIETYNDSSFVGTGNNLTANVDGNIPPMQAFWVQCSADGLIGDIVIDGSVRTHDWGLAPFLKSPRPKALPDKDMLRLYLYSGDNRDETIFIQSSKAQDTFDSWDSRKMLSKDATVAECYSLSPENVNLTIQSVKPIITSKDIKLGLSVGTAGQYKFVGNFNDALNKTNIFLEDKKMSITQDLTVNPVYIFTSDIVGFNSVPDDTSRFVLHILAKPKLVVNNSISVCTPNTVNLTAETITTGSDAGLTYTYWLDANATVLYNTPNNAETGTYYIKGTASNGSYNISSPINVVVNPSPTVLVTNPAPVTKPATVDLTSTEITLGSTEGLIYSYWLDINATVPYSTPQTATQGDYYIKGTIETTGCYSIAGPVTVVINPGTNVIDPSADQLQIYTYDNQIHILNCELNSKIYIFDLLGCEKYTGIIKSQHEIINSNLKTGLYIVKVASSKESKSRKVIIR